MKKTRKSWILRDKLIVFYFVVSFLLLTISDETPLCIIFLIVANFANSARLVSKLSLKQE